jgi:purine-nucleoside/S-methyl-5'-thioadenosine phosphorylase / adenosine deaminase
VTPLPLAAEALTAGRVRHGFFDRQGGVSRGLYAALNCGFGSRDARPDVAENRARVVCALGLPAASPLNTVHQVHGTEVAVLQAPWPEGRGPKADAQVTRTPGLALAVLSADCAPVLFADAEAGVVGAAHAGWRGALAGVTDSTVAAMCRLGARPERIRACVGPCIGQASYEVGPEFEAAFRAADAGNANFFVAGEQSGKYRFDLAGYLVARLARLGLAQVACLAHDTCAEATRFFSYRRSCHRGEPDYGRMASVILLQGE